MQPSNHEDSQEEIEVDGIKSEDEITEVKSLDENMIKLAS